MVKHLKPIPPGESVVIVTSEVISDFIAILVASQFNDDYPLIPIGPSAELKLVNEVLATIWRGETINWDEYDLDPTMMHDFVGWILLADFMSDYPLQQAYAITVPDLTGTLIYHFNKPLPRRLFDVSAPFQPGVR